MRRRIDRGNENLAELPKDMLPGVVAKIREWEAGVKTLEARRAQLAREAELNKDVAGRVREAAEMICSIGTMLNEKQAAFDQRLIRENVAAVECTFRDELVKLNTKRGPVERMRSVLDSLRVKFRTASLLGGDLAEVNVRGIS